MAHSFTKHAEMLLDASNVSELVILSFSLQAFLILFARFRKEGIRGKRFVRPLIWFAYLSTEKVAAATLVRIISSTRSTSTSTGPPTDILLFWASFLLLHVGGPDNITSFAQEDNELWKRRLFWLLLRVFLTLKAFLSSFSKNKLRLPTILVLFAGITKCAERIFALYRARFANFAMYWVSIKDNTGARLSIPAQFEAAVEELERGHNSTTLRIAVRLFSNLKRALVGPLLSKEGQIVIKETFRKIESSKEALRVLKIELSLLFELLHTKLPVIDSKGGFCLRMANYGCIFLALVLFSLAKRHYQLGEFDLLLTYGLLIGALALDFLSIMLLFEHSDWLAISHFQKSNEKKVTERIIARQDRWSNEVPQLNFITYHVEDMPVWLNKLVDVRDLRSLVKDIKGILCQSSYSLDKEDRQLWRFIYYELETFSKEKVIKIKGTWLGSRRKFVDAEQEEGSGRKFLDAEQEEIIKNLDYTKSLLVWHIVTELCYHEDDPYEPETNRDYRLICKVLSDYMFYLAIMQPDMMATVLDNWNTVFRNTLKKIRKVVPWSFFLNQKTASRKILYMEQGNGNLNDDTLSSAARLARSFARSFASRLDRRRNHYRWKQMSQTWVDLMCHAAVSCRPIVHAKQPSRGGELLTLVWLLINHLGLGNKIRARWGDEKKSRERADSEPDDYRE